MGAKIIGTGSYLPPRVVTNDELAKSLDTSDEWIYSHTGIHSRHIAGPEDCTSKMAAAAAEAAMRSAGLKSDEIGAIVLATSTPDYNTFPSTACIVQDLLGCRNACAWDVQAACAGFIYALESARGYLELHPERPVLVIGAETLSRVVDWTDRGSCILFGDGAGAVVMAHTPGGSDGWKSRLGADGSGALFISRDGGTRLDPAAAAAAGCTSTLTLKGRQVFSFAVKTLEEVCRAVCEMGGIGPSDLDRVFSHQANGRIIESVAKRMELPLSRFYLNIDRTGNTSAASIPIALDDAVRSGELAEGMRIAMIGFGSGLTYGGTMTVWPGV